MTRVVTGARLVRKSTIRLSNASLSVLTKEPHTLRHRHSGDRIQPSGGSSWWVMGWRAAELSVRGRSNRCVEEQACWDVCLRYEKAY